MKWRRKCRGHRIRKDKLEVNKENLRRIAWKVTKRSREEDNKINEEKERK